MTDAQRFAALVRERSKQHQAAFKVLMSSNLHAPALALVRQELDSMIRVIYLLSVSKAERARLIAASVAGKHWTRASTKTGRVVRVTDRELADYAQTHHAWVKQFYRYGCNLIHLSDWHGYKERDPTESMSPSEQKEVVDALEQFHKRRLDPLTFSTLLMHAPYAIDKIGSNLECYVKDLEKIDR